MSFRKVPFLAAFSLCCIWQTTALAQGGWDVWTVYLTDGSRIEAAPVWSLDKDFLRYGMQGKVGEGTKLKRSLIVLMSRNVAAGRNDPTRPKPPEGDVKKDLIVMRDGRQISGNVHIRAGTGPKGEIEHFSPVLVQHGVETRLTELEHIRLAKPKRSAKS